MKYKGLSAKFLIKICSLGNAEFLPGMQRTLDLRPVYHVTHARWYTQEAEAGESEINVTSGVKSVYCFCRGPRSRSQNPHGSS